MLLLPVAGAVLIAAQQPASKTQQDPTQQVPEANPGRPTVATPATLTPTGYFQFESGVLAAWHSPGLSSQQDLNEVIKFSVSNRFELLAGASPFVHTSGASPANGSGDVDLGIQAVIHHGEGANPTVALAYFGRVYDGGTPDLDVGSFENSTLLLISADVKGFHYDTNYFFNEVVQNPVRRLQSGQTLSVSHSLKGKFGLAGEIWHFTQPFLRGNAVGNLWALNYNARKNLVFDCGFDRGLTSTSTRWEVVAGFTYLLPHKLRTH
ncbi:MAG: hypothetical protein WA655_14225 [Candidatus Korobacteraceae bacterium]